MISRAVVLAAAVLARTAAAQPVTAPIAEATVREDVFPPVAAEFPDGIVARPGVEFANLVGYRPLRMDVYFHRDRGAARPAVVWVHGGGWDRGDGRTSSRFADWPSVLAALAARGYVVASVEYRLSGEARFPAPLQDVKAAVRFLRANAREYGVDTARVMAWGGSAGGHLAALAATTCGEPAFAPQPSTGRLRRAEMASARPGEDAAADCVQAAALWFGVFDLGAEPGPSVRGLLGCDATTCEDAARRASPVTYVDRGDPPVFVAHGLADASADAEQSRGFAGRLKAAGVPVEELYLPGIGHGWQGPTHAETTRASRLALERTFAFFDRVAGAPR